MFQNSLPSKLILTVYLPSTLQTKRLSEMITLKFKLGWLLKRDSTIKKQSPLSPLAESSFTLSWDPWIKKRVNYRREGGYERHLASFIIGCVNCFSIMNSLLIAPSSKLSSNINQHKRVYYRVTIPDASWLKPCTPSMIINWIKGVYFSCNWGKKGKVATYIRQNYAEINILSYLFYLIKLQQLSQINQLRWWNYSRNVMSRFETQN